jgi:hypothetical protein
MSLFGIDQQANARIRPGRRSGHTATFGHTSYRRGGGSGIGLVAWTRALALLWCVVVPISARAQEPPASGSDRPFEITDNSFLVEEALNQEPGIFQNILGVRIDARDEWETTFTQEWPLLSRSHQLSFTLPLASTGGETGLGDVYLHYRFQAVTGEGRAPAFSPRVSLILPSGSASRGLGNGNAGWQVNLPFSKQVRDWYLHGNAGFTHVPSAELGDTSRNLLTPHAAGSAIWRARPMINLLLETVVEWEEQLEQPGERETAVTLVPGVRTGWNAGDTQTVVGVGLPIRRVEGTTDVGVFLYASYELPFAR